MTAQPLFDTARFRDRLTSAGMPDGQARAVTEGFDEALRGATATKADIDRLGANIDRQGERFSAEIDRLGANIDRQGERFSAEIDRLDLKIDGLGQRLDAKIDGVEQRLDAKIDTFGQRLEAKIDGVEQRLDAKIDGVEQRLDESIGRRLAESQATQLRWFVASLFGGLGLLFAALKLFP